MDPISMALSTRLVGDINRVVMESSAKMTDLAQKFVKAGHEVAQIGREMGKGEHLDLMA